MINTLLAIAAFKGFLGCAATPAQRLQCAPKYVSKAAPAFIADQLVLWAATSPEVNKIRECGAKEREGAGPRVAGDGIVCFDVLSGERVVTGYAFFRSDGAGVRVWDVKY